MSQFAGDLGSIIMSCQSGNQNACDEMNRLFAPENWRPTIGQTPMVDTSPCYGWMKNDPKCNQRQTDVKDEKNKVLIFIVVAIVVAYLTLKNYK